MVSFYTLCVRNGNAVTCKSDLPVLYKYRDIGFEEFEDSTKHDTEPEVSGEHKEHAIEKMRWYSAGKGLEVFLAIKAKVAAGERFELPRETVIQISKELDKAVKDLAEPAKRRRQFHLAWCKNVEKRD